LSNDRDAANSAQDWNGVNEVLVSVNDAADSHGHMVSKLSELVKNETEMNILMA
jgi:hypothetical protein